MDKRALALAVVVLAAVMDLLDGTAVNIVLPSIQRDLDAGNAAAGWIATGYTLALGVLLAIGGRLGDRYGPRRVLALGTAGFLLASLACGSAPSPGMLIAARIAQGGMSAVMVPQTLALIQLLYPAEQRGRALGLFAALAGVATVSGPVIGALLTEADLWGLSWRTVFLVNLPLAALVLAGIRLLPGTRPGARAGLDPGGAVLLAAGLGAVLVPLLHAGEHGWSAWMWPLPPLAAALLAGFGGREHRRFRRALPGLMPTGLFRVAGFTGAALVNAAVFAMVFGLFFTLALYLQRGLGLGPLQSAALVCPWTLGVLAASVAASRRLVPRYGRRVLDAGVLVLAAGLAGVALTLTAAPGASPAWQFGPGLLVAGCGMGLISPSVLTLALADMPADWAGLASGVLHNLQHVAGALGIAVVGAVYFTRLDAMGAAAATEAFRVAVWVVTGAAGATAAAILLVPRAPARRTR